MSAEWPVFWILVQVFDTAISLKKKLCVRQTNRGCCLRVSLDAIEKRFVSIVLPTLLKSSMDVLASQST